MTEKVIRLDRSKPFSECRGDRTADDPHHKVHYVQTYKVGKKMIQLFFDAAGILVPDDKKTQPWQGMSDGKPVTHHPLYNDDMRALVAKLKEKVDEEPEEEDDEPEVAGVTDPDAAGKSIDLRSWLKGETSLTLNQVKEAMKAQFGKNPGSIKEAVTDLVLDEQIVPEGVVTATLKKHLPA